MGCIESEIYLEEGFLAKLEKDKKALSVSKNSLISWMLFRGCIDLSRNPALLHGYSESRTEKADTKRFHIRISEKINKRLKGLCEKRYHTDLKTLLPKVIQMEYDRMAGYDIIRKPKTLSKKSFKEIRIRVDMEIADKREIDKLKDLISGKEKPQTEINIKVNSDFLDQLEYIGSLTGIKLSDLIPLMLCEYITILFEGRYR